MATLQGHGGMMGIHHCLHLCKSLRVLRGQIGSFSWVFGQIEKPLFFGSLGYDDFRLHPAWHGHGRSRQNRNRSGRRTGFATRYGNRLTPSIVRSSGISTTCSGHDSGHDVDIGDGNRILSSRSNVPGPGGLHRERAGPLQTWLASATVGLVDIG